MSMAPPPSPKAPAAPGAAPLAPDTLAALKALAELGAGREHAALSSGDLAERLGVSQQTASRKILDLVDQGLVVRRMGARKQLLKLSPAGLDALRAEFDRLKVILDAPAPPGASLAFRGKVSTGLGEGRWYLSRKGYTVALERLLGFAPFPGTLNVALEGAEAAKLGELNARPGLRVAEFQDEGRTFGAVKCFRAGLGGLDAAVVLPERGHHRDVLEVVAAMGLRETLGLRDGDEVEVRVRLDG